MIPPTYLSQVSVLLVTGSVDHPNQKVCISGFPILVISALRAYADIVLVVYSTCM